MIIVVLVLVMVGLSANFLDDRGEISIANYITATRWQHSHLILDSLLCNWRMLSELLILFMLTWWNLSHTHTHMHVSIILMQLELNKHHQAIKMPKLHQFLSSWWRKHVIFFLFMHTEGVYCAKNIRDLLQAALLSSSQLFSSFFMKLLVDFVLDNLDV